MWVSPENVAETRAGRTDGNGGVQRPSPCLPVSALRTVLVVAIGLVAWPVLWLAGRLRRSNAHPWVVGGHRGRVVEDNSAALFFWMRQHTDQPIVWIGNPNVVKRLRADGHPALVRGSLAARLALFSAPVLVYSHGEDDLDPAMHLWRRTVAGMCVYLWHGLTLLKGGEMFTPAYQKAGPVGRWFRRLVMTDFDLSPALSPFEQACFRRSFPDRADRIPPHGGGAHLDAWFRRMEAAPVGGSNTIYWFPTHRDSPEGRAALADTLRAVTSDERLRSALLGSGWTLRIGAHINTGEHDLAVEPPFELRPMAKLLDDIADADVFVTDYSGLIGNAMLLDRPTVLFPFDLDSYLQHRYLHVPVEDLATGPLCYDTASFVDTLVTGAWRDTDASRARREAWKQRLFPLRAPVYAEGTYRTLCAESGIAERLRHPASAEDAR